MKPGPKSSGRSDVIILKRNSLWSHGCKTNESCLLSNRRKWLNCCLTINVMPYFPEDLGLHIITSWGFSCNWKDDTPSQQAYFVLQHSVAHFSLSTLSLNIFWRCCWTDALTLLIQPSVRAQSSIHSCYILILSVGSASGSSVKGLTVWGVERDQDWYRDTFTDMYSYSNTETPSHKKHKNMLSHTHIDTHVNVTHFFPNGAGYKTACTLVFLGLFAYSVLW